MAAISMKRTGFGSGTRGRKGTLSDPAMTAVLAAYKASYGQVSDGAGGMRDMTDDEVTDKIFDGLIQGIVNQGSANAKTVAAKAAEVAVAPLNVTMAADNT